MTCSNVKELASHREHEIVVGAYGDEESVTVECLTCGEVLLDPFLKDSDDDGDVVRVPTAVWAFIVETLALGMEEAQAFDPVTSQKIREAIITVETLDDGEAKAVPDSFMYACPDCGATHLRCDLDPVEDLEARLGVGDVAGQCPGCGALVEVVRV